MVYIKIKNYIIHLPSVRAVEWGHNGAFSVIRIYYKIYGDATEIKFDTQSEAQEALDVIGRALLALSDKEQGKHG